MKAMQYRQELAVRTVLQKNLDDYAYVATWCPKAQKYGPKMSQKSHFEICGFAIPPVGDTGKKIYIAAQLRSIHCTTALKVLSQLYI